MKTAGHRAPYPTMGLACAVVKCGSVDAKSAGLGWVGERGFLYAKPKIHFHKPAYQNKTSRSSDIRVPGVEPGGAASYVSRNSMNAAVHRAPHPIHDNESYLGLGRRSAG
ncbi:hypothetical protein B0H14DRAFT_2627660 [Mycena olivaceomarginata]|nr:hypothetical protein B0H14DRAFT_2627660 [Mycena olivaceomarginata]